MVKSALHICIGLFILMISASAVSQRHVFSEVKINRSEVYVGQPVEVSVGIYTSTWFTKGLNFGNIKVNGAFTLYFRSVSTNKKINGKTYAGVIAIYNVFPYDDADLVFPSLEFTVETPNEGDYKGIPIQVKTQERTIPVRSVPNGFDRDQWLVASGVNVSETWSKNETRIKVGDVIQRSITRNVNGTVSELIPPIIWDSISGISSYPTRSEVRNEKTKTSIKSFRTEGVRYLFEKEGVVTLPEIEVSWWNPNQKKLFKRTLASKTFEVLPNPDLGMLESARDSLEVSLNSEQEASPSDEEKLIFGLTYTEFARYLLGGFLLIYVFYRLLRWVFVTKGLLKKIRDRRVAYLSSEPYFYKRFQASLKEQEIQITINALYRWIDQLNLEEPTLQYFAQAYGNEEFKSFSSVSLEKITAQEFKNQKSNFQNARSVYLQGLDKEIDGNNTVWINP